MGDVGGLNCGRTTVTTGGTAVPLDTGTARISSVTITAETDNTGIIVIGDSSVVASLATRKGTPLNAGDSATVQISQLSAVYLDTTVNGDGVTWTSSVAGM
jgi:hypothetical protein